jgi:hypothetical protein
MSEGQQPLPEPFDRIKLLREEIRFEHQLIANRLSMLLTAQPFLLTAFAVAAAGDPQRRKHFSWFSYGIVPVVGLVVVLFALLAVVEGERRLRRLRRHLYEDANLAGLADKVCPRLDARGQALSLLYAVALPAVFAVAWLYILATGIWLLAQGQTP